MTDDERAEAELRERQQRDEDLRFIMSSKQGRRFVWRVIDSLSAAFSPSFAGEAQATAYNEGRRAVGLGLVMETQRVCQREYVAMLAEQLEAKERKRDQE
jgi:hypothetical protein